MTGMSLFKALCWIRLGDNPNKKLVIVLGSLSEKSLPVWQFELLNIKNSN